MNYELRFKEIGLAVALSLVIATPARSKILPLSTQKFSGSDTDIDKLNNLDKPTYSLIDNLSPEGYYQPFPIFTYQISLLPPILENKILEKKSQKKFIGYRSVTETELGNSRDSENLKFNTSNITNLSKLTIHLQDENALVFPSSDQSLALLSPLSEKRTLISRYELLKKKTENHTIQLNLTEKKNQEQPEIKLKIPDQLAQKQKQQTNKNFHEIQQPLTSFAVQNQAEIDFTNLNLTTRPIQFNLKKKFSGQQQHQLEQKLDHQTNKIYRVNEIPQPLTTVEALYQPDIIITNLSENLKIAQQIIQVINIRLNSTEEGLEIILETLDGQQLQVNTSVDENTLIADIPNAMLSLPDAEEFTVNNPIEGITNVTARTLDANTIRVIIEGETNLPTASVLSTDEGLILTVNPVSEEIEVVISAARTGRSEEDIPRSITVIPREQIESQGSVSATNNVSDILGRLVPGYGPPNQVERGTRAQSMRGRPALILIDGVVQNSNVNEGTELNTIDPSAIERIEVIRGPSALYGSGGTGGIINIITREPTESKIEQQVRIGANDSIGDETFPGNGIGYNSGYSISGNQGIFNWRFQASLNQNNRFYDADGEVIPLGDLDGVRSLNFLTKMGLNINENQRLKLSYNLYNDRNFSELRSDPIVTTIPGLQKARDERVGEIDYEEPPEQTNHNLSLTYNHDNLFGSKLYTQLFFQKTYYTDFGDNRDLVQNFLGNLEIPPDGPFVNQGGVDQRKLGTRFQINTPIGNSANLLWGFDYTNERNDTEQYIIDPIAFDEDREANIVDTLNAVPKFELSNLGIFAEGSWDVNEKLVLTGGVRYETIHADFEDWTGSPLENVGSVLFGEPLPEFEGGTNNPSDTVFNFGVLYQASSAISLFANFTEGFSLPSLNFVGGVTSENFNIEDDDLLEPEKVHNYEIGIRGNWQSVQFTLAGYYNHTDKGQNVFIGEGGGGVTQAVRSPQRNYGVEATLDWQPANNWRLGGSFTWMEGEGDFPGLERSWQALSSLDVQPIKLTLYVENQTLPGWRNRLQLLHVGDRDRAFDEGIDQISINSYTTVDLISTLNTGFGRWELGVENLFNNQYFPVVAQLRTGPFQEPRRYAAPGRSLSIRYLLNF